MLRIVEPLLGQLSEGIDRKFSSWGTHLGRRQATDQLVGRKDQTTTFQMKQKAEQHTQHSIDSTIYGEWRAEEEEDEQEGNVVLHKICPFWAVLGLEW